MNVEEVKAVLREVYKRQGFLVIGQPERATPYKLGQIIQQVFQFYFGTEFEVVGQSNREDFTAQDNLIAELRPTWKLSLDPQLNGARFFRIKPAMRMEKTEGAA